MRNRRCVAFLIALFFACTAFADAPLAPTLTVGDDDGNVALTLTRMHVRVTVRGHLARTEFELTYHNAMKHTVGGKFHFPLPPDAEVSDAGLYVNGKLRHAVAVERVLARTAYEEVVHRAADPALIEWNHGRAFDLEVYPIPAEGDKQVVLAYDQELTSEDYLLDVRYGEGIKDFDVQLDAEGRGAFVDGVVRVPRDTPSAFVVHEPDENAWYASAAIDVQPETSSATPAAHVVILYDNSSSSVQQNRAAIRAFMTQFLARQQASGTADVVPFNIAVDTPRRIARIGTPAGARALEQELNDLQPLGATNFAGLASHVRALLANTPPNTRLLLVTDGLTSLGDSRDGGAAFAKLAGLRKPLLVVNAAQSADAHLLANAARATGGWWLDLTTMKIENAVEAAMHVPQRVDVHDDDLLPRNQLASHAARLIVAKRSDAAITKLPVEVTRELSEPREISMVRRAYARAKLRDLLANNANDAELLAHGLRFTQLTPRTSLLVLESWRDYEQYGIPLNAELAEEKRLEEEARALQQKLDAEARQRAREIGNRASTVPMLTPRASSWIVRGRVTDGEVALPGVTVLLADGDKFISAAITDAEGNFTLAYPVAPANASVIAYLEGFDAPHYHLGRVPSGTSIELAMRIVAVLETITVTAVAAPGASPEAETKTSANALRTIGSPADKLLQKIASLAARAADIDDEDDNAREEVVKQHFALASAVIEKLKALRSTNDRLRYYIAARALLGGEKSFHVFAAEALRADSPQLAVRVLTDLAEARSEDAPMLRILARVLDGWNETELARLLLRRAAEISPGEAQTWRELVLLDARRARASDVANWKAQMRATRSRVIGIEAVYEDVDALIAKWDQAPQFEQQRGLDLRTPPDADLTVELMFDTGWSYVDLHVIEPGGEDVAWNQQTSKAGGKHTGGFVFGYGPQIYTIANAPHGTYRIEAHYFSDDETTVGAESLTHVIVSVRPKKGGKVERKDILVVMREAEERRVIGTVTVE
ncbi:MAG: hypothetical protein M3Q69_14255 [Acidobacteriota bacterium]|nr:hypothetical protein [Acidobacteriota bacterium]